MGTRTLRIVCRTHLARWARRDQRREQEGQRRNLLTVVHLPCCSVVLCSHALRVKQAQNATAARVGLLRQAPPGSAACSPPSRSSTQSTAAAAVASTPATRYGGMTTRSVKGAQANHSTCVRRAPGRSAERARWRGSCGMQGGSQPTRQGSAVRAKVSFS